MVKGDILATINCDSEALDKFMRGINELPQWTPGDFCAREHQNALQDEHRLRKFLDLLHLIEYFEVFRVFSHCNEWWSKLPLFTDEEMRIWFGMDKPGHLIRFRLALKEYFNEEEMLKTTAPPIAADQVKLHNRTDMGLPVDLAKSRSRGEDEILVLFQGNLVSLRISAQEIRIASRSATESSVEVMHTHKLEELLYVYQDGEDLTKFGYQLVDTSWWEFQTASIVTSARAVLIIAHRFGF